MIPQRTPALSQVALATHPQTFASPPPPQVWGLVQVPHWTVRYTPQRSRPVYEPQFLWWLWHSSAFDSPTQVHWLAAFVPQASWASQPPQSIAPCSG
jgi:hypothetical protein